MVEEASRIARRQPIARLGRLGLFVRCLIGLYLISLVVAAHAAVPVAELESGGVAIELCTADGVRSVLVDESGRTSDRDQQSHHASHDCAGCSVRCTPKVLSVRTSVAVVRFAAMVAPTRDPGQRLFCGLSAAGAPLPPRGPPIFS